jgi:hypothetical protein
MRIPLLRNSRLSSLVWLFMPNDLYDAIKGVILTVADALLAYFHGEERSVRSALGRLASSPIPNDRG